MSEGSQPQRFCRQCGAQVRSGAAFCVSCGASLSRSPQNSNQESEGSSQEYGSSESSPGSIPPLISRYKEDESHQTGGFDFGQARGSLKRKFQYFLAWFRDQPTFIKQIVVPVVIVGLLIVISPLTFIAGVGLIAISLIALLINVTGGRAWKRWGVTIAVAIVPVFMFGGLSDAMYGTGFVSGRSVSGEESSNEDVGGSDSGGQEGDGSVGDGPSYEGGLEDEDLESVVGPTNFKLDTVQEIPLPFEGSMALLAGSADSLYDEDLQMIAQDVASVTADYDAVELEVVRSVDSYPSNAEEAWSQGAGMYSGANIKIAHTSAGSSATGVPAGEYLIEPRDYSN